ncbi:biotin-dependent carboxyltransferase family protein [Paraburkholderia fungorum]|jgi:biotin-dependent carboxylase-like uncharacterized protein|uniref:5-oxoprolinase subunit C family protein n=1 Tax=Paraburkholderia fungorum TaxID=134537 RepID=UPI0038B86E13
MIEILSTGPLCSVQDAGRRGCRHLGVGLSGAMDQIAYRVGNVMVGNPQGLAGIEVTVFPFKARFSGSAMVAVTGADCNSTIGGKSLPPWWSFEVSEGDVLTLSPPKTGARAYIAVSGGIEVAPVLNSRSTDIKAGFGGFQGRCLKRGDILSVGATNADWTRVKCTGFGVFPPQVTLQVPNGRRIASNGVDHSNVTRVRVVAGPEYGEFTDGAKKSFWSTLWSLTPESNRIGYRMEGPRIELRKPLQLLSHGILPGVIQVPPSGKPIVMMSDAQTSGGYPKIGTVIEADLWRLAQAPLGSRVKFEEVEVEDSIAAAKELASYVQAIENSHWRTLWK